MSAASMTRITPALAMRLKLRAPGICDYCDEADHTLFACMGETHCDFVHGCADCITRHVRSTHQDEDRIGVREVSP